MSRLPAKYNGSPLITIGVTLALLFVHSHASAATTISDEVRRATLSETRIWVFLSDKGTDATTRAKVTANSPRTAARITTRGSTFDEAIDLPIHRPYCDQLLRIGMVIKNESRWLNAVTGWVHSDDLDVISALPFVDSLRPVATFRKPLPEDVPLESVLPKLSQTTEDVFDYGASGAQQLTVIGVNYLHRAGLTGRGVRLGFMDTGFSLGIRAFDCMNIQGTRDFINGDDDVGDGEASQMRHGTQCLSLCGAFDEGELVGPAPAAEYVVAKTELVDQEIEAEEDNWVAGLEWLDSMGCDIVSSSLGYTEWYTDDDYDGNTAPSTIAADLAAARGMLVVNAAGNAGCGNGDIRLIVPADGDSVLTVGASTFAGERASFSSCGPTSDGRIKPDVIAPGQGVWTALPNTGFYQPGNGTSFATPIVSGLCALLLENDPSLTPSDLIELLRSTADQADKPLVTYGWGVVRAVPASGLDTNAIEPNRQFDCVRTANEIVIWPNPAFERAVIDITSGPQSNGSYRIFTITGGLVYEGEIDAGHAEWSGRTMHGERAAPAVYLVHVLTENVNEVIKLAWLPRD